MAADNLLPVQDVLARATMNVSRSHMLLTGVVDAAVFPDLREVGQESLAALEDAIRDLRDVGVSLLLRSHD